MPDDISYNAKDGDNTANNGTSKLAANPNECDDDDDDEEAEDMEAFIQSGMLDEADAQTVANRIQKNPAATSDQASDGDNADGILQTRTYDLYITYDKYYQTARLFLYGYDEQHKPLSDAEMYADFR
ncbi:unnamed protein product [Dibothriocephalus latus]|uniref:Ubiquitin-like-conjugating enzyme ATG3 n=1 Tax=Dibothriocephalus latus TaxID=60516 RepID=A0A3P7P4I7_DIBLA|nr:unnamed protein product [Dibothriocephalus latus]